MLQKQPVSINFSKGLDTKTDPYQVNVGNFLALQNSVFTSGGRLTKRYGFQNLTALPNDLQTTLTTVNGNLVATGSELYAYSEATNKWLDKGLIQPVNLSVQPLVRNSTSQSSPDTAVAPSGLTCLVYIENSLPYYQVIDSITGQQIVGRTALPSTAVFPRTFILGVYFIITFIDTIASVPSIQYIAIPLLNPLNPSGVTTISSTVRSTSSGYDGYAANNVLYLAWEGNAADIKVAYLNNLLVVSPLRSIAASSSTYMSVTADSTASRVWVSYWDSTSTNGFASVFNYSLIPVMTPTQIITATAVNELTSAAVNGQASIFYQVTNDYGYATIRSDYIESVTIVAPISGSGSGTVGPSTIILRSVGLGSKAFVGPANNIYMLVEYGDKDQPTPSDDTNQPTYFLIDQTGAIYMRLAYSNGGGYYTDQVLPSISQVNGVYYSAYLITDLLAVVNKGTNVPAGTPSNAIYTQVGISLAEFSINNNNQHSSEIAEALHLTGGQLWMYDEVKPVEHGFHVWPENIATVESSIGTGGIPNGTYYYQFTYEWTDNQGNLHRSAPSIPVTGNISGGPSNNTIFVPTLRLTYKIPPNPVRIVGYRWSVAQQVYYQFTSILTPVLNDTTIDYVTIIDSASDAQILGQTLLYTTGGVVEDIAAPASIASALFDNRLWLIDAEDRNLLWFSKQVIEDVPVEMSDLLTMYVAPTTGAQSSTGPMTAIFPMDDKLIIFKKDAAYYINGTGPDNTGSNSQYSQPIFITAAVGCANPNSIVLTPNGLMFQSDKGIWLLGRDLSTNYIGAPVEQYNSNTVMSATAVPATTQVRFILNNSITLMYDYYYSQWGTHNNILAISATLYQNTHTYLNNLGQIFQEAVNTYLDGSEPVLLGLTTSWINIAGLQGYERFYFMYLLGTYYTPFKLNVNIAYSYNASAVQSILVTPDNFTPNWGNDPQWGSNPGWGGANTQTAGGITDGGNIFAVRIFPSTQKCESFQISISEIYDPAYGSTSGQGLSLSGLNLIVGMKKGYRVQRASRSFG